MNEHQQCSTKHSFDFIVTSNKDCSESEQASEETHQPRTSCCNYHCCKFAFQNSRLSKNTKATQEAILKIVFFKNKMLCWEFLLKHVEPFDTCSDVILILLTTKQMIKYHCAMVLGVQEVTVVLIF